MCCKKTIANIIKIKIQNSKFKKQKIKYRRTAVRLFYNNSTLQQSTILNYSLLTFSFLTSYIILIFAFSNESIKTI